MENQEQDLTNELNVRHEKLEKLRQENSSQVQELEELRKLPEQIKRQADFASPPLQVFADIAQRHLEADGRVGGYYCFCDSASPMMITAVPAIASGGSDSPSTRTETAAAMSGSL